jgi:putative ATPase
LDVAQESIQRRAVLYDKDGDAHYDTISAFIKSVRGSDPDAALYWLAKMIYAGEDPKFIIRRLIILAGEDIGLLGQHHRELVVVANSAAQKPLTSVSLPEEFIPSPKQHAILLLRPNPAIAVRISGVKIEEEDKSQRRAASHIDSNKTATPPRLDKQGPYDIIAHDEERSLHARKQYLPEAITQYLFFIHPSQEGYESEVTTAGDTGVKKHKACSIASNAGKMS